MKSTAIVVFTLAVCAVACAAAPRSGLEDTNNPTDPADDKDAGKAAKDAGKKKDAGKVDETPPPDETPPDETPPSKGECSSESTKDACIDCCFTAHETGGNTYMAAYAGCICEAANCAEACGASLCDPANPANPDADCQTCINGLGSACQAAITSACSDDPDCVKLDACVGDSSCGSKP